MKHVATPNLEAQVFGLGTLVQLLKRARQAETEQELAFIIVNETHNLVPYRQAALWRRHREGRGQGMAAPGGAGVGRNPPFTPWLSRAPSRLDAQPADGPQPVGAHDLAGPLGEEWAEWLPAHGLRGPLPLAPGRTRGALLLAREQPWGEGERHILQELADGFAHAWANFLGGRRRPLLARIWDRHAAINFGVALAGFA